MNGSLTDSVNKYAHEIRKMKERKTEMTHPKSLRNAYISITVSKEDGGKTGGWASYDISMTGGVNKVWITNNDGEGGEFDSVKLFDAIDKFFNDNY